MESAALAVPRLAVSRNVTFSPIPLRRHLSSRSPLNLIILQSTISSISRTKCIARGDPRKFREWFLISFAGILPQNPPPTAPISSQLACISSSATAFGSGGSGSGLTGGSGGGGEGSGSNGSGPESKSIGIEPDEAMDLSPDAIILDVGGMTCQGCAASVKRILESQSQVSSASVNLATETAVVMAIPEAKVEKNWQHELGERLAKHLTSCGFKSNVRDEALVIDR